MHHDEVAVSFDHARFVFQRRRHALDQVEQPLPAGSDVGAVLDVVGRPESFGRFIVTPVN
jgi:ABC-type transport system involved in Fe-S cluster assembly fused permease/ATPase subunit